MSGIKSGRLGSPAISAIDHLARAGRASLARAARDCEPVLGAGVGGDGLSFEVIIVHSTEDVFLEMFQWLRENASWQNRYVTHYNKNYTAMTFSFFFDKEDDAVAFSVRFRGVLLAQKRRRDGRCASP